MAEVGLDGGLGEQPLWELALPARVPRGHLRVVGRGGEPGGERAQPLGKEGAVEEGEERAGRDEVEPGGDPVPGAQVLAA